MDFIKGAADGKVDKIIDQAAVVAKEKVGAIIGGDKKNAEGAKDKKAEGGVDGASGKAATNEAPFEKPPIAMPYAKCLPDPKKKLNPNAQNNELV